MLKIYNFLLDSESKDFLQVPPHDKMSFYKMDQMKKLFEPASPHPTFFDRRATVETGLSSFFFLV